jgi:flagellar FliL protein
MADAKAVAAAPAGAAAAGAKGKDAAAGAKPAEGGAKKKSKLPVLIAAAAIVLLAGGGAAYFLMKPSDADAQAAASGNAKTGDKDKDKKGEAKKPFFVEFETFTSNLKDPDKFIQIKLTFQVKTDAVAESLKELTPVVRAAVIPVLASQEPADLASPEGKEKFTGDIVAAVNKSLAEHGTDDTVDAALITHMLIQ